MAPITKPGVAPAADAATPKAADAAKPLDVPEAAAEQIKTGALEVITVKPGDTLWDLWSKSRRGTWDAFQKINDHVRQRPGRSDLSLLVPGDKVLMPQAEAPKSGGWKGSTPAPNAAAALASSKPAAASIEVNAAGAAAVPHPPGDISQCPFHGAKNRGDAKQLRGIALETMRDRVFGDDSLVKAEKILISALQADPFDLKGETNHLLGMALFDQQKWGDAIKHLEVAFTKDPSNKDIEGLLTRAKQNAHSHIDRPMGQAKVFDRERLLAAPETNLRGPQGMAPIPKKSFGALAQQAALSTYKSVTGAVVGAGFSAAVKVAGAMADKSTLYGFDSWADPKKSATRGVLEIGAYREFLDGAPLRSSYDGAVGFQKPGQVRPEWTKRVRTATGAYTTDVPMEGAAGTEFQGTGKAVELRVNRADDKSLASVREISRSVLVSNGPRTEVPFLNNLAIAWIQFQNHDWASHGPTSNEGAYEVKLAVDDPFRAKYGIDSMFIPRTADNPLAQAGKLTHLNEVTHWWDGSQIYGSDQATKDRLRAGPQGDALPDGKLRIEGDLLPINPETGIEDTGLSRNWHVGLNIFHTIFVKNHNSICDTLKEKHPEWSSDQLFETARLINAAQMAKIHVDEWTKAVIPNPKSVEAMSTNWFGAIETKLHPSGERKTIRPFEPTDAVAGGIVGAKTDNKGKPYGLSEEFVDVYRLHAAMLDHLEVKPVDKDQAVAKVDAEDTRGAGSRELVEKYGMETLLNSFGNQHMAALVNNNYPAFMSETSIDGSPVVDLGAIDLLRSRERGVPPYNEFRRSMGLKPITAFSDLGCDAAMVAKLEKLYGTGTEGVEKMDLLVGTLTEARRPDHFGFGETIFAVFIQMASRRLQADPFFTEKYTAEYYTQEGLDMIDKVTMKDLALKFYPGLAKSGLANVNNFFEPWGSNVFDKPEEHPLSTGAEKYGHPITKASLVLPPAAAVASWKKNWGQALTSRDAQGAAAINTEAVSTIKSMQSYFAAENGQVLRAQHARATYATTAAEFAVPADLPAELAHGPLAPGAKLRAIVRLSNVSGKVESDAKGDLRGIAIRLTDDKGHVQDLMMNTSEVFMAANATGALVGAQLRDRALTGVKDLAGALLVDHKMSLDDAAKMIKSGIKVKSSNQSLAAHTFWSRTPFQLGDHAVKLRLVPIDPGQVAPLVHGKDELAADLEKRLDTGPVRYALQVQGYQDPKSTPMNDARESWDSPYVTVGELTLPRQAIAGTRSEEDRAKVTAEVNKLAFSIGNRWSKDDASFKGIGDINAIREKAYATSAAGRGVVGDAGKRCPYGFG